MLTQIGRDFFATNFSDKTGYTATATGVAATTMTDTGATWTLNQWAGHVVTLGSVYGIIISNTTGGVLTIDGWHVPSSGAIGSTPSTGVYIITPGGAPAFYMALSTDATAAANTDTTLASELVGSGLGRQIIAAQTHTTTATTYTISSTWTSSDGTTRKIEKIGVFNTITGGRLVFETDITNGNEPTIMSGDIITVTETVTTS
jgi:hypothetical protein